MVDGRVTLLLTVTLLGVTVLGNPINSANGIEVEYLEDALGNWLANFDTYTFMVEQDVDDNNSEGVEDLVPSDSSVLEEVDEGDEDYDQGSSAPITLKIKRPGGLLNPEKDYKVYLESLVAEEGSVLVTLGSYENKTDCGVGGFSLPPESEGRSGLGRRLNISHQQEGNRSTTIVEFSVDAEDEENTTSWTAGEEGSAWKELAGGAVLTLLYTPPECGCLMIKAYYALPIGDNLTLVVGPKAYPLDLEKLLCVDPALSHNFQENLIEPVDIEGALEDSNHLEDSDDEDVHVQAGQGRARGAARQSRGRNARRERKQRRQEARQAIRRAGRRVTKQRVRKQMRMQKINNATQVSEDERQVDLQNVNRLARKQARKAARKQARKAKKAWKAKKLCKKNKKHGCKRNKHTRENNHQISQNSTEDISPNPIEVYDDDEAPHPSEEPQTDEDTVVDFILSEEEETEEDDIINSTTTATPISRRGRKHRRQRARAKNKGRKNKDKRKGVKFCCKHGIKLKKSQLLNNNTIEEVPAEISCNAPNDIVITYSEHQFGIQRADCQSRYEVCCNKFTLHIWENVKGKTAARKAKRKQQRKARQQKRKQQRQQRRQSTTTVDSVTK